MLPLNKIEQLGVSQYCSCNCEKITTGYLINVSPAPIIHSYSPLAETIFARLILKREDLGQIMLGAQFYNLQRFLTVQALDDGFIHDDQESAQYTPTIKPHYALAPNNAVGTVYNDKCRILVHDADDAIIFNAKQNVHVHDGLLSPSVTINELKIRILAAKKANASLFVTSYVIDDVGHMVLVTTHCLLNEADIDHCFGLMDQQVTPTTDALLNNSPISLALQRFENSTANDCLEKIKLMPNTSELRASRSAPDGETWVSDKSVDVDNRINNIIEHFNVALVAVSSSPSKALSSFSKQLIKLLTTYQTNKQLDEFKTGCATAVLTCKKEIKPFYEDTFNAIIFVCVKLCSLLDVLVSIRSKYTIAKTPGRPFIFQYQKTALDDNELLLIQEFDDAIQNLTRLMPPSSTVTPRTTM